MTELRDLAEKRSGLLHFDPRKLRVKPGLNVRDLTTPENRAHVEELAESIAQVGVKIPLEIFMEDREPFVASGHCRLAATMLAIERGHDIPTVPCVQESRGTNDVDRIVGQFVYNSGKQLSALEQGANIKRLLGFGLSVSQIATRIGKSVGYVNQLIGLQEAPAEAHQLITSGEVSATLAASEIRKHGPREGTARLRAAVQTAKNQGKTKATAKHVPKSPEPPSLYPVRDPAKIERLISRLVGEAQRGDDTIRRLLDEAGIDVPACLAAA